MTDNPATQHPELPTGQAAEPAAPTAADTTPQGFYGGKYTSIEEWEQATRHSEQEGSRLANRVRELESQLQTRVNPAEQQAARRNPREELSEFGIPVESVIELVREVTRNELAPDRALNQAVAGISSRRPDFSRNVRDLDPWLASHPEVAQRYHSIVTDKPEMADMALEWAYDRFIEDRRAAQPTPAQPPTNPTEGMIPQTMTGGSREASNIVDSETMQRAGQYAQQYGDWGPYGRLRLKEILNNHPDLPKI